MVAARVGVAAFVEDENSTRTSHHRHSRSLESHSCSCIHVDRTTGGSGSSRPLKARSRSHRSCWRSQRNRTRAREEAVVEVVQRKFERTLSPPMRPERSSCRTRRANLCHRGKCIEGRRLA